MPESFRIVPAASATLWVLAAVGLLLVGLTALFGYTAYASRNTRFTVSVEGLRIQGDLYGRTIPLSELRTGEARALDLEREPQLRPRWRTNGVGLPGYLSGWFRLDNREKALLFVTDRKKVVYIPTTRGYAVLLSVAEPERFLSALRADRQHG
ncbi:MAG TPA: PH domain-containing protein [Thermoanaerobaculia bacterium]|nr:PH domain-containing protein [Thermoanaerobaculia bacterium]